MKQTIKDYPQLKDVIEDIYSMFLDELNEGDSIESSSERFYSSVKGLL